MSHGFPGSLGAAILAAATAMSTTAAGADEPVTLRGITPWTADYDLSDSFFQFQQLVSEQCPNLLQVAYLGGPEVAEPNNQFSALTNGVVDVILGAAAYYRTEVPLAAAVQFTTLPPTELRESGYYDLMREVHADEGVVYLANTSGGNKFRIYLKEDLEAPDFSGLRLRASPVYVPLIEALGGTPVLMSPGDVYTALERGLIDGYGWTYTGIGVFGWNEVSGYVIDHPFYSLDGAILINQSVWDGLGDDARACLEEVGVALEGRVEDFIGSRLEAEDEALKEMGMEFITFSPEDAEAYVDAAMTAGWQDFLESNAAAFEGRPGLADALMDAGN